MKKLKEYELIKTEKFQLMLLLDEGEFDYYTNVYIELVVGMNKITIFKDNLLELRNNFKQLDAAIPMLDNRLEETQLGILWNEYYKGLYEDNLDESIIVDSEERWIGEKYCRFINTEYVTWLYQYCGKIIMKVTPVFPGLEEDDYAQKYHRFLQKYKDIFREELLPEQILCMKQIITDLYDKLI